MRLSGVYCSIKDKVESFLNGQGTLNPRGADSGVGAEAPAEEGKTHAVVKIRAGGRGPEAPVKGGKTYAPANVRVGGRGRKRQRKERKRTRGPAAAHIRVGGGGSAGGRMENERGGKVSGVGVGVALGPGVA